MISIENLSKSYGGRVLFDRASLKVNRGERIGLVGRNGHGKTTLFRMIVGQETADGGGISLPKNYRIGYVAQHLDFKEETVLKEGMRGLCAAERDHYWKVEKVLAGLGFSTRDMQRPPGLFSGGYQVRLSLAKVLVSEPDMLLLDEPTNFLHIASIRWISGFLRQWSREMLLITHDRGFMDQVVTHIAGIHRRGIRKIAGDTGQFYQQMAQEDEIHEKTRINQERRKKEIEQFISRFRAKARLANLVQSRVKTLAKLETKEKLEKLKTLDFSFPYKPFEAKQILSVEGLRFGYDPEKPVIDGFSLTVQAGDRVAVVGKNGKGKTTLLRLLAGSLEPQEGKIRYHAKAQMGIYEQTHTRTLVDNRTVEEEELYCRPDVDLQKARNICGAMLFEQDQALKKIGVLSGGEKSRVMLGKLLATPANILLLDEPTNHLDMDACDALLAALDTFEGAVIMVTPNEMFLHALAERLVVFQDGGILVFEGTYQEFLDKKGWGDDTEAEGSSESGREGSDSPARMSRKEIRRKRSGIITARSRAMAPLEKAMARVEDEIEAAERQLAEHNRQMLDASQAGDGKTIQDLSKKIHDSQAVIDRGFDELERLSDELESVRRDFDEQLRLLET